MVINLPPINKQEIMTFNVMFQAQKIIIHHFITIKTLQSLILLKIIVILVMVIFKRNNRTNHLVTNNTHRC
jgi:hypothetical protein